MISTLLSRIVILLLGTLYPAYASYKAVRTKDVKAYVKWMMYWIVFALFTTVETVTDLFFAFWFPFYYELKIVVVLWLLSPATQGSSILYRKFVHPILVKREQDIDEYLSRVKDQGYKTVVDLSARSVQYATQVIMQTAIRGGGGLVSQLRKSYSVGDLHRSGPGGGGGGRAVLHVLDESDGGDYAPPAPVAVGRGRVVLTSLPDVSDSEMEDSLEPVITEVVMKPPAHRAPRAVRPAAAAVKDVVYFTEMDSPSAAMLHAVDDRTAHYIGQVRSVEDISSGYSSTEFLDPTSSAVVLAGGGGGGVGGVGGGATLRRAGSIRTTRSSVRPASAVLADGYPVRAGGRTSAATSAATLAVSADVPSYATLPRQRKRVVKSASSITTPASASAPAPAPASASAPAAAKK